MKKYFLQVNEDNEIGCAMVEVTKLTNNLHYEVDKDFKEKNMFGSMVYVGNIIAKEDLIFDNLGDAVDYALDWIERRRKEFTKQMEYLLQWRKNENV
jgi:hypothetical protein